MIAVEATDDGRPRHAVIDPVPAFSKAALAQRSARRLQPGSDVYSDGLCAFRALENEHAHTVIQAGGRARCEQPNARRVNVVLSNLRRALDGTYHAFRFCKCAHRYLAEAQWRFNRRFDLSALVPRLLVAAARITPWPEGTLRDVPVFPAEASC